MISKRILKTEKDLSTWDSFIRTNSRGSYLQYSAWLQSYNSYGFDYEIIGYFNKQGDLVAGIGSVITKFLFFRIYSCSFGPIIANGYEQYADQVVENFLEQAKIHKAFLAQITIPSIKLEFEDYLKPFHLSQSLLFESLSGSKKGNLVKTVIAVDGYRTVKLEGFDEKSILRSFNSNTRRNIKKSFKNGLILKFAVDADTIKEAYKILELNSKEQGYSVRGWEDFKPTLLKLIKSGDCIIPYCVKNDKIKGALIVLKGGNRLTYISGGTVREKPDLAIGHFLHFHMIKYSLQNDFAFYDISVGGSKGVTRFKEGFAGKHVTFEDSRYWVLDEVTYYCYSKLLPSLKKYKKPLSIFLKKLKK